jgi:nitrate reductase molybdenum cofactor assembly chaperone
MPPPNDLVDDLASLLEYPTAAFPSVLDACRARASHLEPEAADGLERFATSVRGLSKGRLQELYTETFDLSPGCTLDIGWHVFGERHARGVFLSELRPLLEKAGIAERAELPDYLPRLLVLLHRTDSPELADVRDAIRRGVATLTAALGERQSPYEHLVTSAFAAASRGA